MKHLNYNFEVASEQKRVFSDKKVSAFLAETGNVYAASAGRQLSVFYHYALMAGCREPVFNEIRKRAFQVENWSAFSHHLSYRIAAPGFFLFAQSQFLCVRVRRVKIERYGADVFGVTGCNTYIPHTVLVDLIDGHVKAYIVCSGIADVLHDGIVGVAPDLVMALPVSVQAQKDQICLREIDRERAVRNNIDDEKTHAFCFNDQISQRAVTISPKKCLTTAEEQDAYTHIIQLLHFLSDLFIRMDDCRYVVYGAVFAMQVASVCYDHSSEDRRLLSEEDRLGAKSCKIQKR